MARYRLSERATGLVLGTVESPTAQGAIEQYLRQNPKTWLAADDIAAEIVLSDLDFACHEIMAALDDPFCARCSLTDTADRAVFAGWLCGRIRQAARERPTVGTVDHGATPAPEGDARLPEADLSDARAAVGAILDAADAFVAVFGRHREAARQLAA